MTPVGIITAHRPGVSYLQRTISSTKHAIHDARIILFPDQQVLNYEGVFSCIHHGHKDQTGTVRNWLRMVHYAATQMPRSPWFIFMEDDVEWVHQYENPYHVLLREGLTIRELGFISYWTSKATVHQQRIGWHEPNMSYQWCGMLALAMPMETIQLIDKHWETVFAYAKHGQEEATHLDYAVGRFLSEQRLKILCHKPTIVNHIGEVSARGRSYKDYTREPAL